MADAAWPPPEKRVLIGQRINREDGPAKSTGAAKYAYDIQRPGLLCAKCLGIQPAAAKINGINVDEARALPGVKAVWVDDTIVGQSTQYAGQIIAAVAATTEDIAQDALGKIRVDFTAQPHNVIDNDPAKAAGEAKKEETAGVEAALGGAEVLSEGYYGIPAITHCCLEPHGQTCEVKNGELNIWPSTQNVSRYAGSLGYTANLPENKIHVDCQYMGGGFGSKFGADKWGDISIKLSEEAKAPVKLLLERDLEMMVAGNRPSAYSKIRIAAKKDGTVTAWESTTVGSSGPGEYGGPPLPYVFTKIPEKRTVMHSVKTNRGPSRAWRAPNHPQACFLTMSAMADLAAKLGMDELAFFKQAADLTDRAEVYREQLDIAAEMIGYAGKAHLRGQSGDGPIKRGLGISMHTWGGRGHN
ncbi:MAG: molybdopterin-dependent oxidoreductase, partial [FCB group bacterium]|nr:molybdopterin-dependent oxidoreductase [FCB group bacterium]